MKPKRLIIGSRSSKLALVQAQYVRDRLKEIYPSLEIDIKTIKTVGDKITDVALSKIGTEGLFTKEIEEALLKKEIDLAVHSMKDLPTKLPEGLKIAAALERENPCDILVSKQGYSIEALPKNAKIGTSSLRRRSQLLRIREDLNAQDLRGNLDTRLKKLEQGLYDAIILAYAGVKRLGLALKFTVIPVEDMLPQAGQGALAIETREDDSSVYNLVKVLDDCDCHLCINAERALLSGLEGGCQVSIGVYAQVKRNEISIKAGVFSLDGKRAVKDELSGDKEGAEVLGRKLAERILKEKCARSILDEVKRCGVNLC